MFEQQVVFSWIQLKMTWYNGKLFVLLRRKIDCHPSADDKDNDNFFFLFKEKKERERESYRGKRFSFP
jgi:hypothetical protein